MNLKPLCFLQKQVILLWVLLMAFQSRATHLVGGEIFYRHLGNDQYQITLIVYRDCGPTNVNNTGFDPTASIGLFDASTDDLIAEYEVDLVGQNIEYIPVELENPCFVLPPDLCVQKATYNKVANIPQSSHGYYLVYQRCCRNPSITNLVAPQASGLTLRTDIPSTVVLPEGHNNSARFQNFPPVALCASAEFYFDHSAVDTDGDSLVYEFCTPLHGASADDPAPQPPYNGPYNNVIWANTFSSGYQITSSPAFEINSETGFITGTATQVGQYVIGVCVSEYRDGILINRSNRDFQFNVTLCDPNIIASIPEQTSFCDGLTVSFDNVSTNASFFEWDFGVEGMDTDVSLEENPTFTFSQPGLYTIRLIANPGWTCADTAFSVFDARPPLEVSIQVEDAVCEYPDIKYDFQSSTNGGNNTSFLWNFGQGSSPMASTLQNPSNIILSFEEISYTISVEVDDTGCTAQASLEIPNPPDPVASIIPQESFCAGLTYTFQHNSTNATSYLWDFGAAATGDQSEEEEPAYTFPSEGMYVIKLVAYAEASCPDTAQLVFEIFDLLAPHFDAPAAQCLTGNSFDFHGTGNTDPGAQFFWDFGNGATSSLQNPQNISYDITGHFPVTLTITENGCIREFADMVWVAVEPWFEPSITPVQGCAPLLIGFTTQEIADSPMYYQWDFGDGNTRNIRSGSHVYEHSGQFDITVRGYTTQGCIDEIVYTLPDLITVHPKPVASFAFLGDEVNILDPEIHVISTTENAVQCFFYFDDGGTSQDCETLYSFSSAGYHDVNLTVINEFGCTDQANGKVFIDGYLFYAPNAFSPNHDGINDAWIPVLTGVQDYYCRIYDRWGTVIFESGDPGEAWMGNVRGGDHYAESGVYQYDIRFNDSAGLSRRSQGHICLFR